MPISTPDRVLRVLHVEDSPLDHDLAMAHLARAGHRLDALRVDTEAEFARCLADGRDGQAWHVVLSDFKLPGFTGLRAQQILKDSGCDLPFILVSGEIGEDTAVAAMRNGASDYLLKNNLARLAPAVEHAIEAHHERLARQQADRELAASRQRLSELAQHLQTSVEMERAAIAREIHDDVGGSLTAIKFDLAWIARHVESPEVQQRVATALDTVAHAVEASQRIMLNLRPAILEQGLVPALQWMAQAFEKRHGITCLCQTSHDSMQLPVGVPLVAYRFAQEALTNVTKHAQAGKVLIDLSLARGVLSLEVSDNGRGLAKADLAKARSFGLRGLHERAGTVGGWVDVSSSGSGTVLMLSVPIPGSAGAEDSCFDDPDTLGWDDNS
ncbi:hybrid sensor histidine kinase/response regulator [Aquabacterium sp. OR-4]|uniref:hybrid sensor histidine kinase/response regulator n=1 Tax=Aquabacterium sp. OR-4 TaxID=2978127 RepID=UPI0021B2E78B|nr:histidine kinase [Aquabacterium sp. OR-4]MDT7836591.1 histidine kinase [Aquabacterium sp. OR-4]